MISSKAIELIISFCQELLFFYKGIIQTRTPTGEHESDV